MSNSNNRALFCLVPLAGGADEVLGFKENKPYRKGPAKRFLDFPYLIVGPSRPSKQAGALVALGSSKQDGDIWLGNDDRNYNGYRAKHCIFFLNQAGDLHVRAFTGARVCVVTCDTEQYGYDSDDEGRPRKQYELHSYEGEPNPEMTIPRDPKLEITITFGRYTTFRLVWIDSRGASPCWSLVDSSSPGPVQSQQQQQQQQQTRQALPARASQAANSPRRSQTMPQASGGNTSTARQQPQQPRQLVQRPAPQKQPQPQGNPPRQSPQNSAPALAAQKSVQRPGA
jgi:hypothetical protein